MFQKVGWDVDNSQEPVAVHEIKTMAALRKLTPEWGIRIVNAIKKPGGGGNVGHPVTETAEHGLIMLAVIASNAERCRAL